MASEQVNYMDFLFAVAFVIVAIMAFYPKSKKPAKKFGDGLLTDSDTSNWTETKF